MFFFTSKKNTLINPLNQSVFCLYLMQLRPMVINIIHIQCFFFLYVHLILEYNSVDKYECSSFLGTTWRAGETSSTEKQILCTVDSLQALICRGLSLCRVCCTFVVVNTCWTRARTVNCTHLWPLEHCFVWKFPHVGKKKNQQKKQPDNPPPD